MWVVTVLLLLALNAVCVGGVVNIEAAGVVDGAAGVLNNIQHTACVCVCACVRVRVCVCARACVNK